MFIPNLLISRETYLAECNGVKVLRIPSVSSAGTKLFWIDKQLNWVRVFWNVPTGAGSVVLMPNAVNDRRFRIRAGELCLFCMGD